MERLPVELRILGPTELSVVGGRTGSFVLRQPKRLALLAYLALATAGGYRRRDQIVALFWPELDQAHARTQLRKVLHALRSTLGAEAFITRGEEELRLDAKRVWCDAGTFARFIEQGQWADALGLYRGDLLEGLFPGGVGEQFETWLDDQRTTLREQAARAAWECSTQEDMAGRRAEAVALARRAVELDPDDEEGIRRFIAMLDRYGDRAGALRLFRDWQSRLQAEYGAEPAPETRKLARKVRAPRQGESLETPKGLTPERPPAMPPGVQAPGPRASLTVAEHPKSRWRAAVIGAAAMVMVVSFTLTALRVSRGGGVSEATLAVVPLRGLGDSSDVRIGEGLAEELTTALAQVPAVAVRSTARSVGAVRAGGDVPRIGRQLDVALVLDGSVQHSGDLFRITLRLVRTADQITVWARAFNLESSDDLVPELERIAKTVVDDLRLRLETLGRSRE